MLSFSACSASETSEKKGSSSEVVTLSEKNGTEESAGYAEKLFGGEVLDISIETTADDWSYLMENAASKPWISGNITVNGTTLENVGIKTKGNTSLNQLPDDSQRYSLKINFGKYEDGQTCFGLDKLVLNNLYSDSTYLKEYLSYDLFRFMDVPASLCTFAKITVNGEYYGFFIAIEDTDDIQAYVKDNIFTNYKLAIDFELSPRMDLVHKDELLGEMMFSAPSAFPAIRSGEPKST